jgi:hypothetical protein
MEAWRELYYQIQERARTALLKSQEANVRQVHSLERQVESLRERPSDPDRRRTIHRLEKQIAEVKQRVR